MTEKDNFRVDGIDHVECTVPDRDEAAEWYRRTLGLERHDETWVDQGGPLMVSSDGGETKLALFEGDPTGTEPGVGFHRVAFRTDGPGFLQFVDMVVDDPAVDVDGPGDVSDHGISVSVYFTDPWDNPFEVTTYEYEFVAAELGVEEGDSA